MIWNVNISNLIVWTVGLCLFIVAKGLHIKNEYSSNINRIIFHFKQYFSDPNMNKNLKYRTTGKRDKLVCNQI